jgi:hypothetical protein
MNEDKNIYVVLGVWPSQTVCIRAFTSKRKAMRFRDHGNSLPDKQASYRVESVPLNGSWLPVHV